MAHRFATKIHSILTRSIIRPVNNNVFYSDAAYQCTKNGTTRYPINQQNANTYIETLKRSQGLAAVAGGSETTCTLNENVGQWINGKMTAPSGSHYVGQSSDTGNRFFSSKTDADAAAKSRHDKCVNKKEECKSFELCNCDQNKEHMCGRQQYVFKVCQKRLAPYPSFSEACYEEPPKRPDECKCPWPVYAHPTFKPQKKKFHTCCRRFAPKEDGRNNEKEATPSEMVEEEERAAFSKLNEALFGGHDTNNQTLVNDILILVPRNYTPDLTTDFMQTFQRLHAESLKAAEPLGPAYEMKKGGGHGKKCVKPTGADEKKKKPIPIKRKDSDCGKGHSKCRKLPFKPCAVYDIEEKSKHQKKKQCDDIKCEKVKRTDFDSKPDDLTCDELAPSKICPKDLLDRKPYKKYRETQKRLKEKMMEKKQKKERMEERAKHKKASDRGAMIDDASSLVLGPVESNPIIVAAPKVAAD